MVGALAPDTDDAGFTQNLEMMRSRSLCHRQLEGAARPVDLVGKLLHDA